MFTGISACPKTHRTIRFAKPRLLTPAYNYTLQRTIPSVRSPVTLSSLHRSICGYRNVDLLPIGCPFRVRLRIRLTLIRLALIRKPWSFGVGVSHPHYRYLCLHLLFKTLHRASRHSFNADLNAPLPIRHKAESIASVMCLMPDYYPCTAARLVSCYALFK